MHLEFDALPCRAWSYYHPGDHSLLFESRKIQKILQFFSVEGPISTDARLPDRREALGEPSRSAVACALAARMREGGLRVL